MFKWGGTTSLKDFYRDKVLNGGFTSDEHVIVYGSWTY